MLTTIKNPHLHPLLSCAIITLSLIASAPGNASTLEKNQTWYKWNTADGQTQYTQTPPEDNTPFEEIESSLINAGITTSETNSSISAALPTPAPDSESSVTPYQPDPEPRPVAAQNNSFSSIPQNARVIPNKYNYGSTEYKVSPVNAARERARAD